MANELEKYLDNKNVQAFLGLIRDTEGTAKGVDPYRVYGGSHKNQMSNLSAPNFKKWGFTQTDGKKNQSTASGAYQFLEKTWNGLAKQYGLKDFSPRSQDLGAIALLKQSGALDAIVKGDFGKAVQKANRTWASLPGSPYAQHTRDMAYVNKSLAKHLGSPVDAAKYDDPVESPKPKAPVMNKSTSPTPVQKQAEQKLTSPTAAAEMKQAQGLAMWSLLKKVWGLFLKK